jgi:hypothetical protein
MVSPTATAIATATPAHTVAPTPSPNWPIKGQAQEQVTLVWTPTGSSYVDIYRDGTRIATVLDAGIFTDVLASNPGKKTYVYKVCITPSTNCSVEVTIKF